MSFAKAKTKRFNETANDVPPPGSYNPKTLEKIHATLIDKDLQRFKDPQACVNLDLSTASICSSVSMESLTPRKALFAPPINSNSKKIQDVIKPKKPPVSSAEISKQKESEAEIRHLVQERNEMEKKLHQKADEIQKLDGRLQLLQKDKTALEANMASLKKELASLKKINEHLKQNLQEEIRKAVDEAKRPLILDHEKHKKSHIESIANLQSEVEAIKEVLSQKNEQMSELEQQRELLPNLESEVGALKASLNKKNMEISALEKQCELLLKEVPSLKSAIKDLTQQKIENEDFIRHLKGELFASKDASEQEQETLNDMEQKVSDLQAQVKTYQQTEELLNDNIKNMTTKYSGLEQVLADLEKELSEKEEISQRDIAALKQSKEEIKAQCETLEQTNTCLTNKLEAEHDSRQSLETHVSELKKSNDEVHSELLEVKQKLISTERERSRLDNDVQTLGWDKGCLEAEVSDLQQQHNSARKEKEEIMIKYDSQLKDLQGQNMLLKDSLDAKQLQLNNSHTEKNSLHSSLTQLQTDLMFVREQNRTREFLLQEQEKENCRELERAQASERDAKASHALVFRQKTELEREVEHLQTLVDQAEMSTQHQLVDMRDKLRHSALASADCKQRCSALERHLEEKDEVIETLKTTLEQLQQQTPAAQDNGEDWKTLYEELYQKVLPFQAQLESFEVERQALLGRSMCAQGEVDKLSREYAKLLGHQNQKQKIHHILKLKEENNSLKQEVMKLREQTTRSKRTISKLEDQLKAAEGKKKFEPMRAFKSKENKTPAVPLKEGNR